MRLHERYVLGLFLKVLFFCTLSLVVIFFLVDLFEKIDDFIDHQAALWSVTRFFLYKIPEIVRLTMPVDVMLATIITLGILGRNSEIVAFISSGVSMLRLTRPILLVAALMVAISALLAEYVVPQTNERMIRIRRVEIEKREPQDARVRHAFVYRGEGDYLYYARTFNTRKKMLADVTVYHYQHGRLLSRVDARTATWRNNMWEFNDGRFWLFAVDSTGTSVIERLEPFYRRKMPELLETPEDLARLEPEPDAMNYRELKEYVEKLRSGGAEVNDYLVDLHTKISYPFTNLIMAVLGIGLSASKRKTGLLTGVGATLTIAFAYLALAEMSEALGKNETISPFFAAWLGPALFALASIGLFGRVNR
ncbi:MAG: LPS export ABC transporter permease LptG [Candidatus Krumholzibacteriia bacterium]